MEKNPAAVALGKKGGLKTLERRGPDYMKELSKKAVEARKRKKMDLDRALGK